jgi:hypothetical protein
LAREMLPSLRGDGSGPRAEGAKEAAA